MSNKKKYQEIFAKYQINIKNILNYEYVNSFKNSDFKCFISFNIDW